MRLQLGLNARALASLPRARALRRRVASPRCIAALHRRAASPRCVAFPFAHTVSTKDGFDSVLSNLINDPPLAESSVGCTWANGHWNEDPLVPNFAKTQNNNVFCALSKTNRVAASYSCEAKDSSNYMRRLCYCDPATASGGQGGQSSSGGPK